MVFDPVDWQTIDLACQAYNKVSISLYDTLGIDACGEQGIGADVKAMPNLID